MMYVLKFSQVSVFLKFYQYLWSEFSKNTDKSVYLEALYEVYAEADDTLLSMCM